MTMSEIESVGSRETNLVQDPGKRMFFRRLNFNETPVESPRVSRKPTPPVYGRWLPEVGEAILPGDVFWCVWQPPVGQAGQSQLVIGGDEGALLHRMQGQWKRYQTAERLPVHALHGRSEDDLYAVGWMGQVLHYDGHDWHNLRGARRDDSGKWLASEENTPLFSVCGDSTGQIWAVGDNGHILHFDGEHWQKQHSDTTAHLRSIITLPNGKLLAGGTDGTLLLGSTQRDHWCCLDTHFQGSIQSLLVCNDQILLAGGEYCSGSNQFEGRLMRATLELSQTDGRLTHHQDLIAARKTPRLRHLSQRTPGGPVFVVGDSGFAALLKDDEILNLGRVVQHDLLAGVYADDLGLVAIGDFGTMLINEFDQTTAGNTSVHESDNPSGDDQNAAPRWLRLAAPTRRQLWAVATDSAGRVCCCGDGGVVLRLSDSDDTHWQSMGAPTDNSLHCLVGDGDRGFYVAGQMGQIYHYDGDGWTLVFDLQMDITLIGFYSPAPDCIFAVGDEGLIVHWDGEQWQRMSSGTKSALYGIWGLDEEHVLAVGDFGLVLRWNGTEWREFHVGTENFLFGVWGDALDNIHVVGLSGTIGHFDGKRWQLTPARAREDLLSICEHQGDLFAVGVNGVVLHKQKDQWVRESCETDRALRSVCASSSGLFAVGDQGHIVVRH